MKSSTQISIAIREKRLVKIIRQYSDSEIIDSGFILNASQEYLLLHVVSDFLLNGYIIVPICDIERIHYGKFEKYYEMIHKEEGIIKDVGIDYNVDLKDLPSIFNSIKQHKEFVIAECQKENDDRFIIGPIEEVSKNYVQIRYFDATGYLKQKPINLKYSDITTIQFDSRYINCFSKYLRKREKNVW